MIYLTSTQPFLPLPIKPCKCRLIGDLFLSKLRILKVSKERGVTMSKNITELVFILDRSGSMAGLEDDTIGGFNAMIEKQKAIEGEVIVSTVLFDNRFEVIHNRKPLAAIEPLTSKDYYVKGTTALLDAIGRSLSKIHHLHHTLDEETKPNQVMFVIMTDGKENASREFNYKKIRGWIDRLSEEEAWEFIFLGANINAFEEGKRFGMRRDRVANYHADKEGTNLNYTVISDAVTQYRKTRTIKEDWKSKIDKDYKSRTKS